MLNVLDLEPTRLDVLAGALAHNNYDNNVSRLTENVIRRFLDPAPF